MRIQELEKHKNNFDIINSNNTKLQKEINNFINQKKK